MLPRRRLLWNQPAGRTRRKGLAERNAGQGIHILCRTVGGKAKRVGQAGTKVLTQLDSRVMPAGTGDIIEYGVLPRQYSRVIVNRVADKEAGFFADPMVHAAYAKVAVAR